MIVKMVHIITILVISICLIYLQASSINPAIVKRGCDSLCGEVEIPYPFGMKNGSNCYAGKWFEIECRNVTTHRHRHIPYLKSLGVEVTSIDVSEGTVWINNPIYRSNCGRKDALPDINKLGGSPFVYSQKYNKFVAVGCNNIAFLQSNGSYVSGCVSICDDDENDDISHLDLKRTTCTGKSCCETSLPSYLSEYSIKIQSLKENQTSHHCSYAMIIQDASTYSPYYSGYDSTYYGSYTDYYPNGDVKDWNDVAAVLEWEILNSISLKLPADDESHYCYRTNVTSSNSGWRCTCKYGFTGNPYIARNCTGVLSTTAYIRVTAKAIREKPIIIGVSASIGSIILIVVLWWLFKVVREKIVKKVKEKFYKRNGGLLLEQRLSSGEVNVDKVKHFSLRDLEKATDHFNKNRVLGKGGQGTVYKGMLIDGKIIAVKKFKVQGNVEEFINEFVILSQINHRNVVKLLGCCLETKVPLLVYEFIPNGNLFEYLHEQNEDLPMTWDMRLRIAAEVAGALFYLHSVASQPIYHRDIKSTNILLDEKYRAKVADFGTSRMVPIEATHLTTVVQGTFGYLDPEYFHTSQFTEKSDVYSFGVVLVELLTGQKPISSLRPEEARSLASHFNQCMEENRLFDIIDERVTEEGEKKHIITVAILASRCLELNGRKRPTMKEVTLELEGIRKLERKAITQEGHDELELVPIQDYQTWTEFSTSNIRSTFDVISRTRSLEDIHILTI